MATMSPGERPHWREEELRLLRLVCAGYPNKAIAAELGVSTRAVTKRLTRLPRLFAVDNRVALVGAVVAAGLVDLTSSSARRRALAD